MLKMRPRNLIFLSLVIVLVIGALAVKQLHDQLYQPLTLSQPIEFEVGEGQTALGVLHKLKSQNALTQVLPFKVYFKIYPELTQIKKGYYLLTPDMNGLDVLLLMRQGKEIQYSIQLVEGLRWKDWLSIIQSHPQLVEHNRLNEQVTSLLQQHNYTSLEGLLLPDTYFFTKNTSAFDVVKRAFDAMQEYLTFTWQQRDIGLPYDSSYEMLIMASIVEKETGIAAERPHIAGVFVNRLNQNMRLQTDPTVIYGMGDNFHGDIRRKDLKQATPYNTYVIKGLPPTPIAMPSKLAIQASAQPLETDSLYFVAKGDGSHQFSTNLRDHNAAVRKYQLKK